MFNWKQKAYDLLAQRAELLKEAQTAYDAGDEALFAEKKAAVEGINTQIETAKAMQIEAERDFGITGIGKGLDKKDLGKEEKDGFIRAIKSMVVGKALTEGTDGKGGYLVPEEIETQIREFRDSTVALADFVTVQTANTDSGAFTYRSRSASTGFSVVDESGKASALNGPEYQRIPWIVKKYMGVLPVSNELVEDSDADIEAEVVRWAGEESRTTENREILSILQGQDPTAITGIGGLKTALNVTLGSAFKGVSRILTNDNGLDYLDQLTDETGRPLLNPDPTASSTLQLRAGATVVPITVVPNSVLANVGGKIPFIVGSLGDAVLLKRRTGMTIFPTKEGSIDGVNAFEQDMTLFRVRSRMGTVRMDEKAWVYCLLGAGEE